jgi:hypothetical protein
MFSFTVLLTRSDSPPSICRASSIRSATRNSDRPAARATKGSTAPASVQLVGSVMNAGDHACPETRPCPHPSPGERKPARTLAGKADGTDVLLGNVEFQHRHTAQLNTHAKRHYQLGMAEQVREAVEKTNKRLYGKTAPLHFRDSSPQKGVEEKVAVSK